MGKAFLITDTHVIDPVQGIDGIVDIGIKDGVFVSPSELKDYENVSYPGKILCPGFIDVHVHLRDPGQTHKEDIVSGTNAAAAGGFAYVLAMPNTVPAIDTPERMLDVIKRSENTAATVLQSAAITYDRKGEKITDLEALAEAGAPAFTDDGNTTQSSAIMFEAMQRAAKLGIPVIDHCEATAFSKPGVMHRGKVSEELGLPGQPRFAEEYIVARDISLSEITNCRLHLQHLSSGNSVEMLREARRRGINVSGEATPHHLFLTDEACRAFGTNAKMAPPLREESDRLALIQALQDGTITVIATDHAPHTAEEKAQEWSKAPFGIVGIETVVPLCLTELFHKGILTLPQLISLFTRGPRELLNLPIGSLAVGERARITLLDTEIEHIIDTSKFASRSSNCPYNGWKCKGKAYLVDL